MESCGACAGEQGVRDALTEAFSTYGEVSNVRLPMDRETGEMKGIGFIEFATAEAKVGLRSSQCVPAQRGTSGLLVFHTARLAHAQRGGMQIDVLTVVSWLDAGGLH